jgi:hypothetical protein
VSKLDRERPYATIVGHSIARYEQNGLLYAGNDELIGTPKTVAASVQVEDSSRIMTDSLAGAMLFLRNVLKEGPLSKAVVYKESENNLQFWDSVRDAALELKVHKFTYKGNEMWKLPDEEMA